MIIDTENKFISFTVRSEERIICGDRTIESLTSSILCLHGAGTSNRKLFTPLRHELIKLGISSIAFDFIGHGETGGNLKDSSLKQRFVQVCDIIKLLNLSEPLSIIANSMSGHTAIKLLETYDVKNLILIVPAVYHAKADEVGFNQGFSEIIRQPNSWLYSDAWKILNSFQGNLLIISAEEDDVIPIEVIHRLYEAASLAKVKQLHCIKKAPHKILSFLNENPTELQEVCGLITSFLQAT